MSVIQGEQAIQRLAALMRNREDEEDPGMLAEAGESLDEVFARIRAYVERTGKACKGSVTITIGLKGYRSRGGEVAVDVEAGVAHKAPAKPKRETILFLDHEAHAHTQPVQEELPMFNPKAVDGGKAKDETSGAPRARGKAV